MKKLIILSLLILFFNKLYSDQLAVLTKEEALNALFFLQDKDELVYWCACCEDDYKLHIANILDVKLKNYDFGNNTYSDKYGIRIKGITNTGMLFDEDIDLAYLHYNIDDEWFNVGIALDLIVEPCTLPFLLETYEDVDRAKYELFIEALKQEMKDANKIQEKKDNDFIDKHKEYTNISKCNGDRIYYNETKYYNSINRDAIEQEKKIFYTLGRNEDRGYFQFLMSEAKENDFFVGKLIIELNNDKKIICIDRNIDSNFIYNEDEFSSRISSSIYFLTLSELKDIEDNGIRYLNFEVQNKNSGTKNKYELLNIDNYLTLDDNYIMFENGLAVNCKDFNIYESVKEYCDTHIADLEYNILDDYKIEYKGSCTYYITITKQSKFDLNDKHYRILRGIVTTAGINFELL